MIQLFTTFFLSKQPERQSEINYCVKNNIQNPNFEKINIFLDQNTKESDLDQIFSEDFQFAQFANKINIILLDHIPTYKDWLVHSCKTDCISILCNTDIYFDDTIQNVDQFLNKPNSLISLSRYEDLEEEIIPHPNPHWSQDVWAVNTKDIENMCFLNNTEIQLGKCRCDNKLAYFFAINNWKLFNPVSVVKCYHKHSSNHRTYNKKDLSIKGALAFVHPSNDPQMEAQIELCIMPLNTKNITKCYVSNFLEKKNTRDKSDMNKLSFFGASVTNQKTGYVHHFKLQAEKNSFILDSSTSYGYGSMHIRDAGMCFIDDALENNPEYCFIDWFSTAYIPSKDEELNEYLDTIRYKLLNNQCVPIFLLLSGNQDHMHERRIEMYNKINEYCIKYSIPLINVHNHLVVNNMWSTDLFRDSVHTNDLGSEVYGKIIYEEFIKNYKKYNNQIDKSNLKATKYINIKSVNIEKEILYDGISIEGSGRLIGVYQKCGPFSGIVEISHKNGRVTEQNLWDRWCYYERNTLKIISDFEDKIDIRITQKDFDRSESKGVADWNVQKVIKPSKLFYIGSLDNLEYN